MVDFVLGTRPGQLTSAWMDCLVAQLFVFISPVAEDGGFA
jgi:hypothetical protein